MSNEEKVQKEMKQSIILSFSFHIAGFILIFLWVNWVQAREKKSPEVFTVTLEGGEVLGGVSQVPEPGNEEQKPPQDVVPEEVPEESAPEPQKVVEKEEVAEAEKKEQEAEAEAEKEKKQLEKASLVEELEKEKAKRREEEKKKQLELEKKKAEEKRLKEERKKAEAEKKKREEAKRKAELEKKKRLEEERARKKRLEEKKRREKAARDKRISEIARRLKSTKSYEGESVRAGGEGFGAARLGGSGGGGGTLAPYAKVAYQNELIAHVKSGWRWMQRSDRLRVFLKVDISPTGEITRVSVIQSSGNRNFDDSAVRAVKKASPVPPAPREFYEDFSSVRFEFDSKDN